jgi:hypothetical protein
MVQRTVDMRFPSQILEHLQRCIFDVSGIFIAASQFKQDKLQKSKSPNIIAWKNAFVVAFARKSDHEPSR